MNKFDNPEFRKQYIMDNYNKEYHEIHGAEIRNKKRNHYKNKNHRFKKYDLSLEGYKQLLYEQDGKCAICQTELIKDCIDHDHDSGKVRGILCYNCNWGLGQFQDDIKILASAIKYLERSK